jgi:hypothetical protein
MSKVSLVFFLVASIIGAFGSYRREGGLAGYGSPLAWGIVALWALLELVGVAL